MFAGLVEVGSDKDLKILSANRTYVCLDIINKENIEHTAMEKIKTPLDNSPFLWIFSL